MKHNRSETENTGSEITFVKRAGTALGAGAMAMLAVGAVSVYAFIGGNNISTSEIQPPETETVTTTTVSQAEVTAAVTEAEKTEAPEVSAVFNGYERSVSRAAGTIRKAGLDEYDLILETVKATETTASSDKAEKAEKSEKTEKKTEKVTDTEKTETAKSADTNKKKKSKKKTTASETAAETKLAAIEAPDTEAETIVDDGEEAEVKGVVEEKKKKASKPNVTVTEPQSEVKTCGAMTLYSIDKVNLRTEASLNAEVIAVLPVNAEVIVTGYTEDWYRVKFDGNSGFCMKKYFTESVPEKPAETVAATGDVISYNDTEFDMLCYVLQGEVGNCSEASKIAVANVIINRVKDSRFPDTIEGVLTQPDQFDAIYGYYGGYTVPTANTIECAKRALAGEDNTSGAIYYYAPQYVGGSVASWFESLQLCLELDGQRYFK